MAFKCGFFNAINSDRKYNADDMMNPIKGIVGEGVIADDKKYVYELIFEEKTNSYNIRQLKHNKNN